MNRLEKVDKRGGWNKGLSKGTDIRVKNHSEAMKKYYKTERGKKKIKKWKKLKLGFKKRHKTNIGRKLSEKTKEKISKHHKGNTWGFKKGKNNRNWTGGKFTNSHGMPLRKWYKLCEEIKKRDDFACRACDKTESKLHVHHIIPWRLTKDNSKRNLITLCPRCHRKEENKFKRYGVTNYIRKMIMKNMETDKKVNKKNRKTVYI